MKGKMGRRWSKLIGVGFCAMLLSACGKVEDTGLEESMQISSETISMDESMEFSEAEQDMSWEVEETKENTDATDSNIEMRENLTIINDTIYDEVLNPIGTVLSKQIIRYSETDPERKLYEINFTWPEIDVSFAGADLINETMLAYLESSIAYMEEMAGDYEEVGLSFSSGFSGFSYRDDHYISFLQEEYDYEGGAHGMPYWEPFTFQLQTGEKLGLSDVIANSEEELKEIVTEYFAQKINEAPEEYWENALDIVRDEITLESNFVLTPEGIRFYFEPYLLAPYAAGFPEVIIPFAEFDMKINLEAM